MKKVRTVRWKSILAKKIKWENNRFYWLNYATPAEMLWLIQNVLKKHEYEFESYRFQNLEEEVTTEKAMKSAGRYSNLFSLQMTISDFDEFLRRLWNPATTERKVEKQKEPIKS